MRDDRHLKVLAVSLALAVLLVVGTSGYMFLEEMTFLDALYMTVITVSTVGFKEVAELDPPGKLFTMVIIICGLGLVAYAFTNFFSFILEGEFKNIVRRRRMEKQINRMKDHYILCGAGQTGQSVIERFQRSRVPFIVVEKHEEKVEELIEQGNLAYLGDATHEETLEKVNIKEAKGLVSCLSNDADNVFTVLTARGMNNDLRIVSRAIEKNAHSKLLKAGANNTISPNELGGTRMASLLLRPAVVSFLDIITHVDEMTLDLEEVQLCERSDLPGKTLKEARIPERTGLIVLAIKKQDEEILRFNPGPQEKLEAADKMLVLGMEEQVDKLRKMACEPETIV